MTNGNQIKALRLSLGFTQEEFAHHLGVTLCTVNRWENNKSTPSRLAQKLLNQLVPETNPREKNFVPLNVHSDKYESSL